jgi:hypothetical protein
MNARIHLSTALASSAVCLAILPWVLQGQVLKNMDYLVMKGGQVQIVTNGQALRIDEEIVLTPALKITTNGVLRVGTKEKMLREGQKLTLDGLWLANDGMLIQFEDHYMFRNGKLWFVQEGAFALVTHDVVFPNGTRLRTDGLVATSSRLFRLQDGQMLTLEGASLPALDYVMKKDGKIVLQKDGSILAFPPSRLIIMSDGTQVRGDGTIVMQSGQTFVVEEGERLTLEGAAMPKF